MITIFADASFCPRSRVAGWGAWAKADGWEAGHTFGGPIHSSINNAAEAEIAALGNALHYLSKRGNLPDDGVMLQSDCLRALQLLHQGIPRAKTNNHKKGAKIPFSPLIPSPFEKRVITSIKVLLPMQFIELRHVRGHQNGEGRNWVNRTCDSIARSHMQSQRIAHMDALREKASR